MDEPKNLVLKLEGNALSIEMDIRERKLIASILLALVVFVNNGYPLRITQCFTQSLSKSQRIATVIISKGKDMLAWADDFQGRIRCHQSRFQI